MRERSEKNDIVDGDLNNVGVRGRFAREAEGVGFRREGSNLALDNGHVEATVMRVARALK